MDQIDVVATNQYTYLFIFIVRVTLFVQTKIDKYKWINNQELIVNRSWHTFLIYFVNMNSDLQKNSSRWASKLVCLQIQFIQLLDA